MPSPIALHRARAFKRQSGLCFYCGYPMWDGSAEPFIERYNISRRQAPQLHCTGEHLRARVAAVEAFNGTSTEPALNWCSLGQERTFDRAV
ncbi:hypothetical protein AB3X96_36145 [Paraburkholderia sp. BR13439]|uniref:hypothetical protein n=1 Tax=Paraburkholderia sp. BR13439 TaxID=3236996 RepID=UPI0034CEDC6F